jgi:VCBS repeat-containing protein
MKFSRRTFCFALASILAAASAGAQTLAFPGAYGFGANATGGRGGTVYHVTNLNDSGTGSFRDAVSAGNRIIVFDVGGYISLQSSVSVSSNLTIAGQTAPGGGIGLMGGEISLSDQSNIIIRNVRIRQGTDDADTGKSDINLGDATDVILDHCSFEFGEWDTVDAVGAVDITVQNSIIADPIVQQFGAHVETGPSTFYRNLWANAHNRQPLAKDDTQYINNVVYDYQAAYTVADTGGDFSHDIVNNYFITGPATTNPADTFFQIDDNQSAYAVGNMLDDNDDGVLNGSAYNTVGSAAVLSSPWSSTTSSIPTLSAADAYASLVAYAGAMPRDSVDDNVIADVTSLGKQGSLWTTQVSTGLANNGYGTIASGTQYTETSGNGIPDYWATANGISTTSASAATATFPGSGYENVEAYVNSLVLPTPWTAADLAGTPVKGQSTYNSINSQWVVTGSGTNSSSSITQGQFASQPFSSGGTFIAEILSVTGSAAEAGILIDGTGSGSVALVETGAGTLSLVGGGSAQSVQLGSASTPVWVKIVNSGSTYSGYYSTNGSTYTLVGSANVTLSGSMQAGLFVASGSSSALGTASFTAVTGTGGSGTGPTCTPTAIVPYISVSGTWTEESSATVPSASTVVDLGPQPTSGGTWAWTGPNGFTSTARQIDSIALSAGANVYTAAYTNTSGCKSTQAFTITVSSTGTPGFTLAPSAASLSLTQGKTATDTITVTDVNGFSGTVTFAASGLPSGVTAAWSGSTLTLTASAAATVGSSTITITGTSGSTSATTTIALTVSSSGTTGSGCTIDYTISPQNSTAFGAAITIVNNGSTALSSWTLAWSFANGQTISSLWNGNETQSGANVTVTNESYNGSIPAGGSYTGVGFNGTWSGTTNAIPTAFSLNGTACTVN